MSRTFRAFYLAACAVVIVGLVGSWFVANRRAAPPSNTSTLASNSYDTAWYSAPPRPNSTFEPPLAMLAIPDFLLKPTPETTFDFRQTAAVTPEIDTDYAVLFGESSLP